MLYDVFICHASEDKASVVHPLAERLERVHLHVWYDEFALKLGDSLRRSIDIGLARSRYGIVVLSPAFFKKQWPQRELDGLVARERSGSDRLVLPVWHRITKRRLLRFSPTLADVVGVSTKGGLDAVVHEILRVVRPIGSPLIIARDRLIECGLQPPVVTDEWWLEVVAASNWEYPWGSSVQHVWDRWSFPIPGGDSPQGKGEALAWTAMQMGWTKAARDRRISQVTAPTEVLQFVKVQPGLAEACHAYPLWLACWAPQLTIPGFGGEFERDFDDLLAEPNILGGSLRHEELALHQPTIGNLNAASVACHFVQGVLFGPSCKLYPTFDYVVWLLSRASEWMPQRVRDFLITGMKEWATWYWTESLESAEYDLDLPTYPGRGDFANALFHRKFRSSRGVRGPARADLLERVRVSTKLLGLPDPPEVLAQRFLSEGFIETYINQRSRRRAGVGPRG
jgi:hypothetical protein